MDLEKFGNALAYAGGSVSNAALKIGEDIYRAEAIRQGDEATQKLADATANFQKKLMSGEIEYKPEEEQLLPDMGTYMDAVHGAGTWDRLNTGVINDSKEAEEISKSYEEYQTLLAQKKDGSYLGAWNDYFDKMSAEIDKSVTNPDAKKEVAQMLANAKRSEGLRVYQQQVAKRNDHYLATIATTEENLINGNYEYDFVMEQMKPRLRTAVNMGAMSEQDYVQRMEMIARNPAWESSQRKMLDVMIESNVPADQVLASAVNSFSKLRQQGSITRDRENELLQYYAAKSLTETITRDASAALVKGGIFKAIDAINAAPEVLEHDGVKYAVGSSAKKAARQQIENEWQDITRKEYERLDKIYTSGKLTLAIIDNANMEHKDKEYWRSKLVLNGSVGAGDTGKLDGDAYGDSLVGGLRDGLISPNIAYQATRAKALITNPDGTTTYDSEFIEKVHKKVDSFIRNSNEPWAQTIKYGLDAFQASVSKKDREKMGPKYAMLELEVIGFLTDFVHDAKNTEVKQEQLKKRLDDFTGTYISKRLTIATMADQGIRDGVLVKPVDDALAMLTHLENSPDSVILEDRTGAVQWQGRTKEVFDTAAQYFKDTLEKLYDIDPKTLGPATPEKDGKDIRPVPVFTAKDGTREYKPESRDGGKGQAMMFRDKTKDGWTAWQEMKIRSSKLPQASTGTLQYYGAAAEAYGKQASVSKPGSKTLDRSVWGSYTPATIDEAVPLGTGNSRQSLPPGAQQYYNRGNK